MFKTLYRCACTAAPHENGPAAQSRSAYLEHLATDGATLHSLRANAGLLGGREQGLAAGRWLWSAASHT
jgi:hypothetical protein